MSKVVTRGNVRRMKESKSHGVYIDRSEFSDLKQGDMPQKGDTGLFLLEKVPNNPYKLREELIYEDGNSNNTLHLVVSGIDGPMKYKVKVTV